MMNISRQTDNEQTAAGAKRTPSVRWVIASLSLSMLLSSLGTSIANVALPTLAQAFGASFQLDAALVGIVMSVGPMVAALTGVPAGRIVDRYGTQRTIALGLIGIVIGSLTLFAIPTTFGIVGYVIPIVVITANYALFQAANNTAVMTDLRPDQRGVISGLLNLSRNLGLITGASVMGAVFALASGTTQVATVQPDAVAAGMRITFAVAMVLMVVALTVAVASSKNRRSCSTRKSRIAAVHCAASMNHLKPLSIFSETP